MKVGVRNQEVKKMVKCPHCGKEVISSLNFIMGSITCGIIGFALCIILACDFGICLI